MKPPRVAAGQGQGRGGLAHILPGKAASGAARFFLFPKRPQKPLKPLGYSQTLSSTAKTSRSFENRFLLQNPPEPRSYSPTLPGTAAGEGEKAAPSAEEPLTLPCSESRSSAGGFGGVPFSTPTPIPFTPSPPVEYRNLCESHASLAAYIEREGPEMRASGQGEALGELERLADAMQDRISELHAQGLDLGSAGGGV